VGTTLAPSGLMRQGGFFKAGLVDAKMDFVYGGDLQGNVWRIDMSTSPPAADAHGHAEGRRRNPQPISVRPVVTKPQQQPHLLRRDRALPRLHRSVGHSQQSIYGFKDKDADYGTNIRTANLVVQTLTSGSPERSRTTPSTGAPRTAS